MAERRSRTILLRALPIWIVWAILMDVGEHWPVVLAGDPIPHWWMAVTMVVGSFIAGATSEGGGAVAFPVMTLVYGITPLVARDFSLMIQTVGMTMAAGTILSMRVPVIKQALLWSSLGGAIGIILGIELVAPRLSPAYAKMFFTATWLAFAFALFWINRYRDREVHDHIANFLPRHALLLAGAGVVGGVISGITGSGLDITTFSLLVLRLRISEKVATPTSVILMAVNAGVGFLWKATAGGGMEPAAWNYWWVSVPIVVVGAPLGAWFIKNRSRLYVSAILYVSIALQFTWALVVIPMSPKLAGFSVGILAAGIAFFRMMARGGGRRLEWLTETGRNPGPPGI